ncbi:hypothetical protein M8998_05895 [Sphingobacterium sp. lm-10]|uniref:hypothetical protein n=1 Tax=Sphingobacterium sp. lm-10 TaxID=2944904 RepID=UPI00202054E5|nr:hypothetical protein [Sphingobacterium sp. lm-10]MCL7987468.1 hypothetical protein [Sphingobacterium sp. lm-10]
MNNFTHFIIITLLLATSCQSASVQETENEMFVVNELILLRTEGMALCELAAAANPSPEVQATCEKLKTYYTSTQEEFTYLCTGRSVAMEEEDFDTIWKQAENYLLKDTANFELAFIELSSDNILRSITLHELIVQRQDWEDIMYYAFKSLPELYYQQGNLSRLKESFYIQKSATSLNVKTAAMDL